MPTGVYIRTKPIWNKGLSKKNGDILLYGRPRSEETKRKISQSNKGKYQGPPTSETRKKISDALRGRKKPPRTAEHTRKIALSKIGKKLTEEHKRKISDGLKGKFAGEKNPSWKGGTSYEPYSANWTETVKKTIRERDKYICLICENKQSVVVHHINYDKKNCNPNNLITLCKSCHQKTNFNRLYWEVYINSKVNAVDIQKTAVRETAVTDVANITTS